MSQVTVDVRLLTEPDGATLEALARLQLLVRRHGYALRLHGACRDLVELIELAGLRDVLPCDPGPSGLETVGEPEEREPARRVEEERDAGDATA